MKHVHSDIGDVAMPLSCFEQGRSDYTNVLVVANTWLVFYGLIVISLGFTYATELFASQ